MKYSWDVNKYPGNSPVRCFCDPSFIFTLISPTRFDCLIKISSQDKLDQNCSGSANRAAYRNVWFSSCSAADFNLLLCFPNRRFI